MIQIVVGVEIGVLRFVLIVSDVDKGCAAVNAKGDVAQQANVGDGILASVHQHNAAACRRSRGNGVVDCGAVGLEIGVGAGAVVADIEERDAVRKGGIGKIPGADGIDFADKVAAVVHAVN